MKKALYLLITLSFTQSGSTPTSTIPKPLWGMWIVSRELPTATISCWGEKEASVMIGTEIEYSADSFRWGRVVTKNPSAAVSTISAEQFHDENSGRGATSSQVTFIMLGIKGDKTIQVRIQHPPANVIGATTEIPGDAVLIKDKNTIVFSVCNVYFEARRGGAPPQNHTIRQTDFKNFTYPWSDSEDVPSSWRWMNTKSE